MNAGRPVPGRVAGRPPEATVPEPAVRLDRIHRLELAGAGGHTTRATWGQEAQYESNVAAGTGDALCLALVWRLPPGTELPAVLDAVRTVLEQHETFRSALTVLPSGELGQTVRPAQPVDVEVYRTAAATQSHQQVLEQLTTPTVPLDRLFTRPAVDVRVLVTDRPEFLTVSCPHVWVDALGLDLLRDRLQAALDRRPAATPEQPRDRAELESRPEHRRSSDAAVAHWLRMLAGTPGGRWARLGPGRAWTVALVSPEAGAEVAAVARTTSAPTSVVLLAGILLGLACATGVDRVPVKSECHNRLLAADRAYLGSLVQPTVLQVDTAAAATFADLVRAVRGPALDGYRYGRYDPRQLRSALGTLQRRQGGSLRVPFCFNDLRGVATRPPPADIPPARQRVVEVGGPFEPDDYSDLYLGVANDPAGLRFHARVHDSRLPVELTSAFVAAVDEFLAAAAADPQVRLDDLRDRWSALRGRSGPLVVRA